MKEKEWNDNIIFKNQRSNENLLRSQVMKHLSVLFREKLTPHVDEVVTDGLGGFGIKH